MADATTFVLAPNPAPAAPGGFASPESAADRRAQSAPGGWLALHRARITGRDQGRDFATAANRGVTDC
jgi:hypothetical protein